MFQDYIVRLVLETLKYRHWRNVCVYTNVSYLSTDNSGFSILDS